jgi:hypothetical protein
LAVDTSWKTRVAARCSLDCGGKDLAVATDSKFRPSLFEEIQMHHIKFLSAFVALAAATAPVMAKAATAEVDKTQGKQMSANFFSDTSCGGTQGITSTDVQWADYVQTTQISSPPSIVTQHFANIFLSVRYQNPCSGDDLIMTGIVVDPFNNSAIHISQSSDLSSGHLDGVVHVATDPDAPGTPNHADLAVNLNWTATAPTVTTTNRSNSIDGGVIMSSTFTTSARPGRTSGSVSGTIHLMTGQNKFVNFLNGPSFQASLSKDASTVNTVRP